MFQFSFRMLQFLTLFWSTQEISRTTIYLQRSPTKSLVQRKEIRQCIEILENAKNLDFHLMRFPDLLGKYVSDYATGEKRKRPLKTK